jgi:hypothetical protein
MLVCSCSGRKLGSRFEIEEFDEGPTVYYVVESGVDSPGGVFDGVIEKIGWKGDEILAMVTRLASCDPSGWYILNIKTGVVIGPIKDNTIITGFSVVDAKDFYINPAKYKR